MRLFTWSSAGKVLGPKKARALALYGAPAAAIMLAASAVLWTGLVAVGTAWFLIGAAIFAACVAPLPAARARPGSQRIHHLAASFGMMLILAGYAFGYHLLSQSPARNRTPFGAIKTPESGTRFTANEKLSFAGTAKNLPQHSVLWLVTYDYGSDTYTAQAPLVVSSRGFWTGVAMMGYPKQTKGMEEDAMLVLARSAMMEDMLDQQYYAFDGALSDLPRALINRNTLYIKAYFAK